MYVLKEKKKMTAAEFVKKLTDIAEKRKTVYVLGCYGSPMTEENKIRTENYEFNKSEERAKSIEAADPDTFGFDCSCLLKGVLWGWNGDVTLPNGGAVYASNGVPDYSANQLIGVCRSVSRNFDNIKPGEAVWMGGHIGVYIGEGLAVECTPLWQDGVQITSCNCSKDGYIRRDWVKHGKLPYIKYD